MLVALMIFSAGILMPPALISPAVPAEPDSACIQDSENKQPDAGSEPLPGQMQLADCAAVSAEPSRTCRFGSDTAYLQKILRNVINVRAAPPAVC